jgi:hypothetical protein
MRAVWLIFLAAGCLALAGCGQFEKVEVEEGYRGAARRKPFLAASRLLESRGWEVEDRYSLGVLPSKDRVIILSPQSVPDELVSDSMLEWIRAGGHAFYLMDGFEAGGEAPFAEASSGETNDEDEDEETETDGEPAVDPDESQMHPLLRSLDLSVGSRVNATELCEVSGLRLALRMRGGLGVQVPAKLLGQPFVVRSADTGPVGVLSFPVHRGRLTILADASIWQNRQIGKLQHASLFWNLMQLHGKPVGAWFLRDARISFFGLLWHYGWMPLTGLGLFVVCWLWRSLPRFGPLLPDPDPAPRDFVVHLSQAGAFLWSRGGPETLVNPLRRIILRSVCRARSEPQAENLTQEQWESLARATGLSVERIRDALIGEVPNQNRAFIELLATLQKIALSIS